MATETITRSKDDVTNEYSQCALLLGDKMFKVSLFEDEMEGLRVRMGELNKEAALIAAREAREVT